jgi:hypothetical protein
MTFLGPDPHLVLDAKRRFVIVHIRLARDQLFWGGFGCVLCCGSSPCHPGGIQIMAIQEHAYYGSFGYHVTNFFGVS